LRCESSRGDETPKNKNTGEYCSEPRGEVCMVEGKELEKFERVIDDQDICIGCGSCVATCPYSAWELDDNGKARLLWDRCESDFSCIDVCPVSCIWKSSEAPKETKAKKGWYRFSRELTKEEKKIFVDLNKKYGITG
jgi:ferredoxin